MSRRSWAASGLRRGSVAVGLCVMPAIVAASRYVRSEAGLEKYRSAAACTP